MESASNCRISVISCGILLAVALTAHVTSSEKVDNSLFYGADEEGLSAAALNVRVSFQPYEETWAAFKKAFGRQYTSDAEDTHRYRIFLDNVKKIELHNAQFRTGNTTFWMGINQFTDMSLAEFQAYTGRYAASNSSQSSGTLQCSTFVPPRLNSSASTSVDWRTKGYVTAVKNQGPCGSCWAFSATGSLEGQHFRRKGQLVSLSEQQLVDCSGQFGNSGCNGGNERFAYAYIYSAGGINSEAGYPYRARQGPKCLFDKRKVAASLTGCQRVRSGSEKDLQVCVATQGPVSVSVDVTDTFKNYKGGVLVDQTCSSLVADLNHAVLAVGYGTTGTMDYWIVKNSWGKQWGSQGYILMARNRGNMCGIATDASFPVV